MCQIIVAVQVTAYSKLEQQNVQKQIKRTLEIEDTQGIEVVALVVKGIEEILVAEQVLRVKKRIETEIGSVEKALVVCKAKNRPKSIAGQQQRTL